MKKILLLLGLLLTGCSTTWHVSTTGHDPIYDTVLEVPSNVQIDTLSSSQLRWKLRTDFRFRYDFAQYALSQPRSFDWNNRVLGNRYNVYNPYYGFGYSNYWSRDMMWNDWVWGYNSYNMWSPFRYDRWGYNHYGWNSWGWNGYYGNSWGWRQQMNNYAWQHRNRPNTAYINGRRGSNNIQSRIVVNNTNRTRVNVREDKVDLLANKIRKRVNNKNIRVYNNPNNPNINNKSKPRVYVRPNNNSKPRVYVRPNNNSNNSRQIVNSPPRSSNNSASRSNIRRKN
ncbi:hypothetical protein OAO15_00425 [bacterium]|nr:hypothetical protein [bacterium]